MKSSAGLLLEFSASVKNEEYRNEKLVAYMQTGCNSNIYLTMTEIFFDVDNRWIWYLYW